MRRLLPYTMVAIVGCSSIDYGSSLADDLETLVGAYEVTYAEDPERMSHAQVARQVISDLRGGEESHETLRLLRALEAPFRMWLERRGMSEFEVEAAVAAVRIPLRALEREMGD